MNAAKFVDYATICYVLLPQQFEDLTRSIIDSQNNAGFHSDIDHIPLDFQWRLASDLTLWQQYCDIFKKIITCLKTGESPTHQVINASLSEEFLEEGGRSQYALDYLLRIIEDIGHRSSRVVGYESLPECWNDFSYTMVRQRLLKGQIYCRSRIEG